MADTIDITAGTGTKVSTEEITTLNGGAVSAQHIQRIVPSTRTADGTAVDEAAGAGSVNTSTKRVTLASDDPAVIALQIVDDWDESDRAKVNPIVGQAGVAANTGNASATTQRVVIATDQPQLTNALKVNNTPTTSGGLTVSSTVSAASTNATSVKASAGQVYNIAVTNTNAAARYLKLYNKASAPVVGTDVPVYRVAIPGNSAGGGIVITSPNGMAFSTGIAFALTTGAADSDTGAVGANEILVNLGYA